MYVYEHFFGQLMYFLLEKSLTHNKNKCTSADQRSYQMYFKLLLCVSEYSVLLSHHASKHREFQV